MFKMESVDDSDATDELSSSCVVVVRMSMLAFVFVLFVVCVVVCGGCVGIPPHFAPNFSSPPAHREAV
jgi:hypothetical protein